MTTESAPAERKWIAALVLAVFAAAVAWGVASAPPAENVEPPAYPELLDADRTLVAELAAAWGDAMRIPFGDYTPDDSRVRVLAVLDRDPGRASFPFLAVLQRRFAPNRDFFMSHSPGPPGDDAVREWAGCWLREHADDATSATMRRMVADRRVEMNLRQAIVVALCRPDDAASKTTLVEAAMDETKEIGFRTYVLARIARCAGQPPERLRELLYVPYGRIAVTAALALAEWGDPEAPSLVVEEFRRAVFRNDGDARRACARALLRIVFDDEELARGLANTATDGGGFGAHASDVAEWLDAHPAARDTEFERARREYLLSERRQQELATTSLDVVLAAKDDDFDLAAALLVPGDTDGAAAGRLEQLDRLARLVRRDVGDAPTPSMWIDALNMRLLSGPRDVEDGCDPSDLGDVLRGDYGNCMGLSSLYLAVAERLDLPTHGVVAPQHVFVRWDDGVFRRNIEATERGVEHDDRWYAMRGDGLSIRDDDVRSGAYLANIGKRRFLALALVNRAIRDESAYFADWAVRLAPNDAIALLCRAENSDVADAERAVADLRAAQHARRLTPRETAGAATAYLKFDLPEEALRVADAALAETPGFADLEVERAMALYRLGRTGDGARAIKDVVANNPKRLDVQCTDLYARVVAGDGSWRARLTSLVTDPVAEPWLHLNLATELIGDFKTRPRAARDAADVLDLIRALEAETEASRASRPNGRGRSGDVERQRRTYFRLRSTCCNVLHDDAGAAAAEAALRDIDAKK